jgi:hypothetical protein
MSRIVSVLSLSLLLCLAVYAQGAEGQSKKGPIKSVDAQAKTFVLALEARPLTFTFNDKTVVTLDGKESTAADAIKKGNIANVTYTREGNTRTATKVEVTKGKEGAKAKKQ